MDRHDNRQEDDRRQQGTTLAIQAIHLRSNQDVMIKLFVLDTTAPHASKSSLPHMIKLFVLDTLATLKEFSKGSDRAHRPCAQRTWLLAFSSWLLAFSSWLLAFSSRLPAFSSWLLASFMAAGLFFWRAKSLRAIEADHSTCFLVRAQELHQGSEPMHIIGRTTMFSANQVRVDIARYRERTIKDYGRLRSKGHNTIRLMNSSLSDCSMLGLVHGFTSRRSFIASQSITKYYM